MPTIDHWMLIWSIGCSDEEYKSWLLCDASQVKSAGASKSPQRLEITLWTVGPASYRQNPGKFKAQPKQPGYIRTPYTTVTFTNQVAKRSDIKRKKCTSHFHAAWCRSVLESRKVLMSERKSSPARRIYGICDISRMPSNVRLYRQIPQGFSDDRGLTTFGRADKLLGNSVYRDGHWLKSINQNFNHRRAALMSERQKGWIPRNP